MKNKSVMGAGLIGLATLALSGYVPGDNLHADGIPTISDSLVEDVNRYTEVRTAVMESWHPQRREMLIKTRFADTQQVHLVKMPGGARKQLTFFRDNVGSAGYQPTTGDYFVISKDIGGSEDYHFDCKTGDLTLLTDGTSRNTGGAWSTKGDRMAYESNRRNKKDMDIYV